MSRQTFPVQTDSMSRGSNLRIRAHSLLESVQHLSRHALVTLLVWLLIGVALSLPTGLWLVQHNIHRLAQQLHDDTGLTVYFLPTSLSKEIEEVRKHLVQSTIVQTIEMTSSEQAMEEFQRVTGYDQELLALDENPLPASLSVVLQPDVPATDIEALVTSVSNYATVDSVDFDTEWIRNLNAIHQVVSTLMWIVGALFGFGVVFVTFASVRLAIESKFRELRVLSLIGASDRYLRRPFIYCGILYGFGGGVVATAIVFGALFAIKDPLHQLVQGYGGTIHLVSLNYFSASVEIALGTLLGYLGALFVSISEIQKRRTFESIH
ncbi:MAG: FtsX-like permease family protein [Gammaproteobacteria bacterium]|nr:FtsX-like permease family protein [Gammaproteobacteria bacterium]MYF37316.1 FtsX-like permease family protein [Gammaproteobacteria bacterium]